VLAGAFHVLDVIRFRGHYWASTGSLPPGGKLAGNSAPGALHVASEDLSHWDHAVGYPGPEAPGVWRLTFLVRFRDRLYAGLQAFDREPHDYVVFDPPRDATDIAPEHVHPVSVTGSLGTSTYRWYADRGRLFWIARTHRGVELLVSDDGDEWKAVELPDDAGAPTDVVRVGKALVVLAERALLRLDGGAASVVARITTKRSPFELTDYFCAAPLAVFRGEVYAGGQRGGVLYKLVPGAEGSAALTQTLPSRFMAAKLRAQTSKPAPSSLPSSTTYHSVACSSSHRRNISGQSAAPSPITAPGLPYSLR
jgi:hypothetical protein